jgi:Protein of unknown function (DUF2950)
MRVKKNLRKWAAIYALLALEFGASFGVYVLSAPSVHAGAAPAATFTSPEDAAKALFEAAKGGNDAALLKILGPEAEQLISEGDASTDAANRAEFAAKYEEMHRFTKRADGKLELIVGAENWPLPIPLVKKDGSWSFDIGAGQDEVMYRRIGANEMAAIFACGELVEAQRQYFADGKNGQYAAAIAGDPAKHEGLIAKGASAVADGGDSIAPLLAGADTTKAASAEPFRGYYFRVLTAQGGSGDGGAMSYVVDGKMTGGFAIVAYPAEYRSSGVKSFIVSGEGVVFEKDLGADTAKIAGAMSAFDPDSSWSRVD